MQEDQTPKVFISYSWTSEKLVVPLAERLVSHGIDVVLDKWDLKEGQDKYAFMERSVNDSEITKVLIVCDKAYADKANNRTGGVGDETVIISQKVYNNVKQEKFIPVIAERDEKGEPYVPTYIGTRIYIDLSNESTFELEYDKLVRNIYEKPLYRKPKLGKRPEWIDEEKINFFPLIDLIRQIKGADNERKQSGCVKRFLDEYINALKMFYTQGTNAEKVYGLFVEMKGVRDVFLDFLPVLHETDNQFTETICGFFEEMHNTLTCGKNLNVERYSVAERDYEIYKLHIWELFICVIAYLRHAQDYKAINGIVTNTYFLTNDVHSASVEESNYCQFRYYSASIEDEYKPQTESKTKFTLVGDLLCNSREKLPVFSGEAMAEADLFLYQIRNALDLTQRRNWWGNEYWFPTCYVYCKSSPIEWTKMKSRKYCAKMFELFGVTSVNELKEAVSHCCFDDKMRYGGSYKSAPAILSCIKLEEIGSLN